MKIDCKEMINVGQREQMNRLNYDRQNTWTGESGRSLNK